MPSVFSDPDLWQQDMPNLYDVICCCIFIYFLVTQMGITASSKEQIKVDDQLGSHRAEITFK